MTEHTDEFRRRSFQAAGPVFLVAVGLVLLAVLAVGALFRAFPADVAWIWAVAGAGALALGVLWAAAQRRAPSREADAP